MQPNDQVWTHFNFNNLSIIAMPTYHELLAQMAALQEQTEAARLAERETALSKVRELVETYALTERKVFGRRAAAKRTAPPKYRNPKTGETWTGRGRAPTWIAVQDREQFLIRD